MANIIAWIVDFPLAGVAHDGTKATTMPDIGFSLTHARSAIKKTRRATRKYVLDVERTRK